MSLVRGVIYSLRRGFAIHNLKSGLSARVVQSLGGWESIVMVEWRSKSLSFEDALHVHNNMNGSA
jgi:site-specific recombinase XerD